MKLGTNTIQTTQAHANIDAFYGPYESIQIACERIPEKYRLQGLTIGIIDNGKIVEYQWKTNNVNTYPEKKDADLLNEIQRALTAEQLIINTKLDNIADLETIRSGAAAGATAQQPATTLGEYGITDAYTKSEGMTLENTVGNRLDTLDAAIELLNGSEVIVVDDHTVVTTPDSQKIYREQGTTSYTDWMYQDNTWKKIATYDFPGVDDEPTAGSKNLIESGGIYPIKKKAYDAYNTLFFEEEVTKQVSVPSRYEDNTRQWNVSSDTGAFVKSNSQRVKAFEIRLESNIKTISYQAAAFNSNCGYAFLDDNDNLILGVHTTAIVILNIDASIPIALGATKFRCGTLTLEDNNNLDLTIIRNDRENLFTELQQNVSQNNDDISVLNDAVFVKEQTIVTENINVPVYEYNNSKKWNVDSDNGDFVSTANNIRSIELELTSNISEISYSAFAYSGHRGYAFLDDEDNLILGVQTTQNSIINIDATVPIAQGATKFRCGTNTHQDTYIPVTIKRVVSEHIINRIERLENAQEVKEPYTASTIQIQFDTVREIPNNIFGQNNVDSVTFEEHTGYGLLGLANDYQPYGKPSKLAVFFHGSSGYGSYDAIDFQTAMKPYIDFMRKSGYTVLAPYAWDETTKYHAFATPYSIGNFNKAIKYVIEHYNVETDGIYIWGRSAGAGPVVTLACNCCVKVKAIALHNPLIGSIVWQHNVNSSGDNMVKKYIFDNDENYAWTEQYLTDNYYKVASYENMLNGVMDASITDKINFLLGSYTVANWKEYVRALPFPCKIWAAADDDNVPYNNILIFHQQVINGGGTCEFRQLPSNYTDEEVTTANAHHVVDTAGPRSTVTTKLDYTLEMSNGYIETVEWFDRF